MNLTLSVLPGEYAVCRFGPQTPPPAWAFGGDWWSVTHTADELSVVCRAEQVPAGVQSSRGWTALKLHGPFDFGLTGVLTSVLDPLRDAEVGIFALSTFDTDYVLVAHRDLPTALTALREAGHQLR